MAMRRRPRWQSGIGRNPSVKAAEADWKPVAETLGRTGTLMKGVGRSGPRGGVLPRVVRLSSPWPVCGAVTPSFMAAVLVLP